MGGRPSHNPTRVVTIAKVGQSRWECQLSSLDQSSRRIIRLPFSQTSVTAGANGSLPREKTSPAVVR